MSFWVPLKILVPVSIVKIEILREIWSNHSDAYIPVEAGFKSNVVILSRINRDIRNYDKKMTEAYTGHLCISFLKIQVEGISKTKWYDYMERNKQHSKSSNSNSW